MYAVVHTKFYPYCFVVFWEEMAIIIKRDGCLCSEK